MEPRELLRWLDAQASARAAVTERTTDAVSRLVAGVESFGDPEQVAAYAARAGAIVGAGQTAVAGLTDIYLARVATALTGDIVSPVGVNSGMGETRRRLPAGRGWEDVYERVATTYRVELAASGGDRDLAFYKANLRARRMAETDLGLAMRDQADVFLRGKDRGSNARRGYMFAYRRVLRPELSNGNVCGLCIAASSRTYYRGDLLPLHSGCHCEVMLVTKATDPGEMLNREALDELYDTAGGTDYTSLRRTKYVVEQHGELGPVLRHADHSFRGPADIPAAA